LKVRLAYENDGLVDMVQLDPFVGVFFKEIPLPHFAALALDPLRHRRVLHQKKDLRLL
jgi:hypothetical protein